MTDIPRFLHEASRLFHNCPDQQAIFEQAVALDAKHLAQWCIIHVADGQGILRPIAAAHADPGKHDLVQRLKACPLDPGAACGAPLAWRTAEPWHTSSPTQRGSHDLGWGEEGSPIIDELNVAGAMAVPVFSGGKVIGAMTLGVAACRDSESAAWPNPTILALAQHVATGCGIALERSAVRAEPDFRRAGETNGKKSGLAEMELAEDALRTVVEQQATVAALGQEALAGADTRLLVELAIQQIGEMLRIGRASVIDLLLLGGGPTIAEELQRETAFSAVAVSRERNGTEGRGVAPAEARDDYRFGRRRRFTQDDSYFLQAVANILAEAIRRKCTELDLRASRDHLEAILRGVTDGIIVQDLSGRPIYSNEGAARLFGYATALDLTSAPLAELRARFQLLDESGKPIPIERYPGGLALMGQGNPALVARLRLAATGEERWVHVRAAPILQASGKPEFSVTIMSDVTEAKRTEETLRFLADASRSLAGSLDYRATLENLARQSVPFLADYCLVDMVHEGGEVSRVVVAHMNPLGQLLAKRLRSFAPPGDAPYAIREAIRAGRLQLRAPVSEEALAGYALSEADIQVFRDLSFCSAITVPLGGGGGMAGAVTFISASCQRSYGPRELALAEELVRRCAIAMENARLYQEAQEQRRELQTVLDSMTEGVVSLDKDMRVRRANACARQLLTVGEKPLEGQLCAETLRLTNEGGKTVWDLAAATQQALVHSQPSNIEGVWLELPGGRRLPVALTITPQLAENGIATGVVVLFRDMSRYKELDALRESIISLVSHELKTPLFHIKGFASSLLQTDVEWDPETRLDFIRTIDKEADRLSSLISSILELSHAESGRLPLSLEPSTASEMVNAGVAGACRALENREVVVEVPATLPPVLADIPRMERVLVNLLENAAKYSLPRTRIRVSARAGKTEVVFAVADQGVGIPPDARERVFEKFVRLRDPRIPQPPGTGLGLTLCKAIVEAHGGRIWVEGAEDHGSIFFFTLPIASRPHPGRERTRGGRP